MAKRYPHQLVLVATETMGAEVRALAEEYDVSQAEVLRAAVSCGLTATRKVLERQRKRDLAREAAASVGAA